MVRVALDYVADPLSVLFWVLLAQFISGFRSGEQQRGLDQTNKLQQWQQQQLADAEDSRMEGGMGMDVEGEAQQPVQQTSQLKQQRLQQQRSTSGLYGEGSREGDRRRIVDTRGAGGQRSVFGPSGLRTEQLVQGQGSVRVGEAPQRAGGAGGDVMQQALHPPQQQLGGVGRLAMEPQVRKDQVSVFLFWASNQTQPSSLNNPHFMTLRIWFAHHNLPCNEDCPGILETQCCVLLHTHQITRSGYLE